MSLLVVDFTMQINGESARASRISVCSETFGSNVDSERELPNQSKLCKMEGFTDFIWAIFYLTLWFNSICGISTFVLKIREMVSARKGKSTETGGEQVECSDIANTGYVPLSLVRIYRIYISPSVV